MFKIEPPIKRYWAPPFMMSIGSFFLTIHVIQSNSTGGNAVHIVWSVDQGRKVPNSAKRIGKFSCIPTLGSWNYHIVLGPISLKDLN